MKKIICILSLIASVASADTSVPLGDTYYFHFSTIDSSGAPITMGGTPEVTVYEDGGLTEIEAADTFTTDADSKTGFHLVALACTSGNGFEVGKWYTAIIDDTGSPTVDSVSVAGRVLKTFRVVAAEQQAGIPKVDSTLIEGGDATDALDAATPTANLAAGAITDASLAGNMEIVFETDFATAYNTTTNAWATNLTNVIGELDASEIATDAIGAAEIASEAIGADELGPDSITTSELATGCITNDEMAITGNELTAVPWNSAWDAEVESEATDALNLYDPPTDTEMDTQFTDVKGATFATGTDSLEAIRDRGDAAWGGGTGETPLGSGTAQSGTSSTIVLASAETFADNELRGNIVKVTSGTGAGQSRVILSNTGASDTCNITPNWVTNPSSDSAYEIVPGSVNVEAWIRNAITEQPIDQSTFETYVGNALATYDPPTKTELDSGFAGLNDPTAAAIVDEFETQSQADPTGFHVNVLEVGGTAQTANDNGADINAILADTGEIGSAGAGLTEAGGTGDQFVALPVSPANVTQIEGHALAGTGTQIADGFEYYFNVATPTKTMEDVGASGSGDWTTGEREQMRTALGITGTTAATTGSGNLDLVLADTGELQTNQGNWVTATSVTVSDKTGFSLAADQSSVTIGTVNTMSGTIQTLDGLDTAQDSQHATTQAAIAALNDVSAADVLAQSNAAIVSHGLDHIAGAAVSGTDIVDNSIIAILLSKQPTADFDSYDNNLHSLEAIGDKQ